MVAVVNGGLGQVVREEVHAKGDALYVNVGSEFRVLGRVGDFGAMKVSAEFPQGAFAQRDTSWMKNGADVAQYVAAAVNAFPVLRKNVATLEAQKQALRAKVKVLQAALGKESLTPEYKAALIKELGLVLNQTA